MRYIHQNPVKANLCINASQYRRSSYSAYFSNDNRFVDTDFVFEMISQTELLKYFDEENNDKCLDLSDCNNRINDIEAKQIIRTLCNCSNVSEFQKMEQSKQINVIKELKEQGLSIRQVSRLTGVSFGVVRKY